MTNITAARIQPIQNLHQPKIWLSSPNMGLDITTRIDENYVVSTTLLFIRSNVYSKHKQEDSCSQNLSHNPTLPSLLETHKW